MSGFVMELWAFMKERKKFWLLPIVAIMLLFAWLSLMFESTVITPFIYALF